MEVTLNTQSWHRKLHKYHTKSGNIPSNLCPYFWLTVFFLVVHIPVLLIRAFFYSIDYLFVFFSNEQIYYEIMSKESYFKFKEEQYKKEQSRNNFIMSVIKPLFIALLHVLFICGICLSIGTVALIVYVAITDTIAFFTVLGLLLLFVVVVLGLISAIAYAIDDFKIGSSFFTPFKAVGKFISFVIGYASATKNNLCPGIKWSDENGL